MGQDENVDWGVSGGVIGAVEMKSGSGAFFLEIPPIGVG